MKFNKASVRKAYKKAKVVARTVERFSDRNPVTVEKWY